jgi:hypothetical protein
MSSCDITYFLSTDSKSISKLSAEVLGLCCTVSTSLTAVHRLKEAPTLISCSCVRTLPPARAKELTLTNFRRETGTCSCDPSPHKIPSPARSTILFHRNDFVSTNWISVGVTRALDATRTAMRLPTQPDTQQLK